MDTQTQKYKQFLELVNLYPSPHNGQPMRIKKAGEGYQIFFDTSRGLTATPISYLFSFVTVGVFARYVELCAVSLGHSIEFHPHLPDESAMKSTGDILCGEFTLAYDATAPDLQLQAAIRRRQTSRKKYHSGLDGSLRKGALDLASRYGVRTSFVDASIARQIIWLNQRAVFDDMFDGAVREELKKWMRMDSREKTSRKDGLAYDCMELSSGALKFIFKNYKILHWPVIKDILRLYYLRTMSDQSTVGYVTAPFVTPHDAYVIGRYVIDMWIELSKSGVYLHPFGTVVSNDAAHASFLRLCGIEGESRETSYVVFIFRAGHSEIPIRSERIEPVNHLIKESK